MRKGDYVKTVRKNELIAIVTSILRSLCLLASTGTLLQTFLASVGFSEAQIYLHATLVQACNVATILLFSHFADTKRPALRSALVQIPNGLLFLCFLPFCFLSSATALSFFLLVAISLMQAVFTALNTVCEYKLPYLMYPAESYGAVHATAGILSAIATFGVGELLHFLEKSVPYTRLMLFVFLISAAFLAAAGLLSLCYTAIIKGHTEDKSEEPENAPSRISVLQLVRRPVFYLLIPANLLRGFATGTVTVLATIAISLGFGADVTTRMVSLSAIANLVGCFLFGLASRYLSPRIGILVGSLCYLLLPFCLFDSSSLFLLAYAVVFLGKSVVDIAVPSLLVTAVDMEIAGPYNAYRMILHNGGVMLATAVATILSPALLLWSSLAASLISGIIFFATPLLRAASPALLRKNK